MRARQVLDAVDERREQTVGLAGDLDVGHPGEQLPEHDRDLAASQVGAEAEVRAGPTEPHVVVGLPGQVEGERVVEDVLVAVGRVVEEDDLLPGLELLVAQAGEAVVVRRKWITGVAGRSRRPPWGQALEVGGHFCALGRVLGQRLKPWLMALRVVSLPATVSRTKKEPSSASVRRSPSTSALASAEVRSSVGSRRRSPAISMTNWDSSLPAVRMAVTTSPSRPTYSGSPARG